MTSVWSAEPWLNGPIPRSTPSGLTWTSSSMPCSSAMRSRNSYISGNFQVVSTCSSGNGGAHGWNAFRARCSMTDESFPVE